MMTSPFPSVHGSYYAHLNGRVSLLYLVNIQTSQPSFQTTLLAATVKQMVSSSNKHKANSLTSPKLHQCLTRAVPPTLPRTVIGLFSTGSNNPADDHWTLLYDVSEVFTKWKESLLSFVSNPNEQTAMELANFLERGASLDKQMEQWSRDLPPEWGYTL